MSTAAVCRNRIRRQIRESFRLHQHTLAGLDIVVMANTRRRRRRQPGAAGCAQRPLGTTVTLRCARAVEFTDLRLPAADFTTAGSVMSFSPKLRTLGDRRRSTPTAPVAACGCRSAASPVATSGAPAAPTRFRPAPQRKFEPTP